MSDELYYSNHGRGPATCRIVSRGADGTLILERNSNYDKKRVVRFRLPESFFFSEKCGWKKRNPAVTK